MLLSYHGKGDINYGFDSRSLQLYHFHGDNFNYYDFEKRKCSTMCIRDIFPRTILFEKYCRGTQWSF